MATLYASGNTFHWKDVFKLNGFKWEPDDKKWVCQNLSKNQIYKIIALCTGSRIKFRAISNKGRPLQLEVVPSNGQLSKPPNSDHDTKSMESIDGSKYYSPGYSATNAPKPYVKKITDPGGNRDR